MAVLSGVLGVWFIQQPHSDGSQTGMIIALVAALATAVAMLGLHRLRGIAPLAIVTHFAFVATLCCSASFFFFPLTPGKLPFWHWQTLLLLLGIGVTASIGQLLLTKAFTGGDPAKVSVIGLTQVLFAFLFDVFQEDALETWTVLGMVLIVAPTAWVMRTPRGA